jgi:hypothetical protein
MIRRSRHVVELWQSLGLGRVPTRDRFKIYNFPTLEPHLFVMEVAERLDDYRIVYAGSAVDKSYGAKLVGSTFGQLDLGPGKEDVLEEYELCTSQRMAIASRHIMRLTNDAAVELQRVLLPFDSPIKQGVAQVVGWMHLRPVPKRGTKGAVSRWATEERSLIAASG